MIDLKESPDQVEIKIEQLPNRNVISYVGSEAGFYTVADAIRAIPQPRDTTADMMVRTIAILSTLVGVLYLTYFSFITTGDNHEIHRDRPVQTK
ncbi:MAG: hypothetical protein J0L70_26585 [Leptolyngbya sp. UWPOB_LEPTO1]|uniref:hypothetical protein n=1 Tax=Leptolyngbya sp. UWPOB_LEPTO1 TaxID=2815653 RepID=UPI001AC6036B|nr:hypothetical protein [Leptolyngbya sp. UWPOB_LEPTO1]MBN8564108.1 hypothetical protein [Leptolyngbya sp. UWPOB_LEPTO1]